jgi:hypothetical protein
LRKLDNARIARSVKSQSEIASRVDKLAAAIVLMEAF